MRSRGLAVAIAVPGTAAVMLMIYALVTDNLIMSQVALMLTMLDLVPVVVWIVDYVGERRHEATVQRVLRVVGRADAERELHHLGDRR